MYWVPGQSRGSTGIWVRPDCSSWRISWERGGDCELLWGKDIGGKALGSIHQPVLLWRWPSWKNLVHPSARRSPRPNNKPVGTQPHPSAKRLPKDPPGTQPPFISPRDKAPPTRGIRVSPTYQWAGTSPSHQEACGKPPHQLQPQGGWTSEAREATTPLSAERRPCKKIYPK